MSIYDTRPYDYVWVYDIVSALEADICCWEEIVNEPLSHAQYAQEGMRQKNSFLYARI